MRDGIVTTKCDAEISICVLMLLINTYSTPICKKSFFFMFSCE